MRARNRVTAWLLTLVMVGLVLAANSVGAYDPTIVEAQAALPSSSQDGPNGVTDLNGVDQVDASFRVNIIVANENNLLEDQSVLFQAQILTEADDTGGPFVIVWDFAGLGVSTGEFTRFTFDTPGDYAITVRVQRNGQEASTVKEITIKPRPPAPLPCRAPTAWDIIYNEYPVYGTPSTLTLVTTPPDATVEVEWRTDVTIGFGRTIAHDFSAAVDMRPVGPDDPGVVDKRWPLHLPNVPDVWVVAVIRMGNGCDGPTRETGRPIYLTDQPVAQLGVTTKAHPTLEQTYWMTATAQLGTNVDFLWQTEGTVLQEGGGFAARQHALYSTRLVQFSEPGTYQVNVTAFNSVNSIRKSFDVNVQRSISVINDSPKAINTPILFVMAGVSAGDPGIQDVVWDFGDGGSSAQWPITTYAYNQIGKHLATVRAQVDGRDFVTGTIAYVGVEKPSGSFTVFLEEGEPVALGKILLFCTDSNGSSYHWDFGDGAELQESEFNCLEHTYAINGDNLTKVGFVVTLILDRGLETERAADTFVLLSPSDPADLPIGAGQESRFVIHLPLLAQDVPLGNGPTATTTAAPTAPATAPATAPVTVAPTSAPSATNAPTSAPTISPSTTPPGTIPPSTTPPGTIPPGTIPPGTIPPGTIPPGGTIPSP